MITLLADHNIEGHARLLMAALESGGWIDLLGVRLAIFSEVGLVADSTDRTVWRKAQELQMLLLTDNRNRDGADSLQQTLIDESTPTCLPVLTIGSADRLRRDMAYRDACAERLAEIIIDLDRYLGIPRLYIP